MALFSPQLAGSPTLQKAANNAPPIAYGASNEGVAAMQKAHPEVRCWTAAIDSHLNELGYIIPGLGDAGDKIFGTK